MPFFSAEVIILYGFLLEIYRQKGEFEMTKEMLIRRIPAMMLSGLLAVSNPGLTAYAESYSSAAADAEEIDTEGAVLTDEEAPFRNEETVPANGDLTGDEVQYDLPAEPEADDNAADVQAWGEEELLSDGLTSEAEPDADEEPVPFEQTVRIEDVQFSVTADAGVFAPGTVLVIQKVFDEEIAQKVEAAEGIVPAEQTIVQHSLYSFSGAEMNGSANVLIEEAGLSELQEEYPDSEISSCLYRWDSELEDVEIIPADIDVQKDQAAFTLSSLTVYDLMTVIYMPETAEAPEEIVSLAGADPSEAAVLEQSATVGGVTVTVRYEAGAFPEDAELSVKKVSAETAGAVDEAVADVREEQDGQDSDETKSDEQDVIASYTFDISMLDPEGSELQPAEGFDVQVSFALAEAAEEGIEASVYHIHEDDGGMTAETLDIVSESGDTVTALTDSFSLYNVTLAAVGAGQTVSISYVDAKGNAKGPVDCRPVTEKNLDNGWYAVTEDVSFSENMEVSGNVNLILCDGKTLRPNLGIYVKQDASLTIWAQSTGKDMGKLVADITSSYDYAAIGGKDDKFAGAITINGGNITAKARRYIDHPGSAGIGAGKNGPGYTGITINGGVVEALGSCRAAGIGGTEKTTSMGPIEITGGTVTVTGGAGRIYGGAGIGGGSHCTYSGELIIKITGGDVTVTGGDTGIGLGYYSEGSVSLTIENAVVNVTSTKQCGIQVDTVKITSSQVTVVGYTYGISSTNKVTIDGGKKKESLIRLTGRSGAGINGIKLTIDGEGTVNALGAIAGIYVTEVTINGGEVISTCANHEYPGIQSKRLTINGGDVTAQGGTHTSNSSHKDNGGAGICLAANGTLTINGGMLKATGGGKDGCGGAGIGGNYSCSGTTTHVIINGGTVIAKGGPKAAGIGGGAEGFWGGGGEGCDEVQINGGVVIAQSGGGKSSAIGHGDNDKEYGHIKFKNGMWVHAGWSEEEALKNDPFTAEGRESACQYRHYARIDGECDHPWEPVKDSELKTIRFTEITKTWHLRAPCAYCNQVFAGEAHDFDDAGVCMVCGYQEDGNRITFDANGGTGAMEDRFIAKGRAMALPECLFTGPDGRIFSGWKIGEKTYQEAEPVTIDADVTAVAQWKAPYVITFDPGDGTGEMEPGEAGVGEKYPLPPCKFTEPEWHDFVGWQVGLDQDHLKQPLETITVEGNTTVTARWERPEYAITFDSYGGSKVSNQHALKGAHAMVPVPAPTMEGREFLGWRLDGEDFDFENTPITRDITLVAHWSNEWVDLQKEIDEAEDGAIITLTGNVTARDDDVVLTIPDGKSITIDLAGCTLNRNLDEAEEEGNVITVNGGLTVTDSVGGGVITGGSNTGTGGGIFVEGTFTLDGGTISGNKGTYGGGVQIGFGATFTMSGGTISGNEATYGGGVLCDEFGTFNLSGSPVIQDNTANGKTENVKLESDAEIRIAGKLDDTASVGVTMASQTGVFTTGLSGKGTADNFTSDDERYTVGIKANEAYLDTAVTVTFDSNGGSEVEPQKLIKGAVPVRPEDPTRERYGFKEWQLNGRTYNFDGPMMSDTTLKAKWLSPWALLQKEIDEAESGATITLTDTVTAEEDDVALLIPEGKSITLDMAGYTLDRGLTEAQEDGNVITVKGSLTVEDSSAEKTGMITGGYNLEDGGGIIMDGASLILNGGSITGNTAGDRGGGVYMEKDASTFTMTGGSITDNKSGGDGGGVSILEGSFTMTGGSISSNTSDYCGGGVYIIDDKSAFTMETGAIISKNQAAYGGGVFVDVGEFIMNGGSITENNALFEKAEPYTKPGCSGGGVFVSYDGVFVMKGGSITDNSATDATGRHYAYGGGVFNEGEFTMEAGTTSESMKGGVISGNTAGYGGGVYCEDGFTMETGTISENEAEREGGGVYSEADVTLTNAEISGNYADWYGGGVSIKGSGSLVMTNSRISGNTADVDGGGVIIGDESSFTMNSGSISDNISDERGGGVASYGDSQFIMTGGVISGNKASVGGGGVYTESSFTMEDGEISGNTANDVGGGVECDGDFTMSGGRITGNRIINPDKLEEDAGGGGVYIESGNTFKLSGNSVITDNMDDKGDSNVYLEKDTLITVDDALANSDPIGISMQEPGVFTDGLPGNGSEENFTSDDTAYAVSENDQGEARLVKGVTVTFEANGGTGSMEKQVLPISEQRVLRANTFTREDASFKGWNTKADGSGTAYDDKASAAFEEDTTLYAQWYLHVTLTATTADGIYTGKTQTAEGYTAGLPDGTAVEASFKDVSARGSGIDAGDYDVTFAGVTPGETIDTSGRYMVTDLVPGTLTIAPKELTVTTGSASKPYDGTALVKTDGASIEGLANGEKASIVCTGSQTPVGSSDNTYTIDWESAKESNYTITKETTGTLTVTGNDTAIILTAASAQKTYDGEPLSDDSVSVSGLPEGFSISASAVGTITNAGEAENVVNDGYVIKNARGEVVTTFFTNITKENGTLTIDPAKITITAHDGMGPDITDASSLDYEISGGIVEADREGLGIRLTLGTPTGGTLKTYPVEVVYTPDDNYEVSTVDGKYTVSLNGGFTAHGYSGVYDGVPHSIDVETHDTEGFDILFANEQLNSKEELDAYLKAHPDEDHSRTDVGTTTVYYYVVTEDEFLSGSKDIVITPKNVTVTAEAKEKTYGAADPELTYTVEGLEYDDALTGSLTREAGENVGSYAILKGTLDGGNNYTITYKGADLTIDKRTVGLEWTDDTFTYNGKSRIPSAAVTGLVNEDAVEVTVNGAEVDAGEGYTATAGSLTGDKAYNYALPEDGSVLTHSFSIAPKELTVTTASASKAYDGTALVKTDGASIEGLVEGETATVTATGSRTAVGSSDNTYEITWDSAKASNYKITKENLGTLTVTANDTEIVLTAASVQKTYDGTPLSDDSVTVTGLPDGFAISVRAAGSLTNAGQADNVAGDPVITDAAGEDVTSSFTNVRKENGTLTIVPAAITITANDGMGPDITDASSLGYEISGGIVEADKDALGIRLVLGTPAGGTLKTYPVEVIYTPDDNYEISTVDGKYTVSLNGGFTAHGYSGVYDGVPHSIDVETQDTEGFDIFFANEKLNTREELETYLKAHPDEDHSRTDVGTTTVYYYVVTDAEFFSGSKDIVITPKIVTVTADAKKKTYGDTDPELTYKSEGLEDGDTLTGALTREAGENVGSYAVLQGNLDAGKNYTIVYTGADLTIKKRTVGLTWTGDAFTYNGESQAPKAVVTGLVNSDAVEVTVTGAEVAAGEGYTVKAESLTGEKAGNYALPEDKSVTTHAFTIAPKELTVTTASASKPYDGTALVKTDGAKINGLVKSETADVKANGSRTEVGSSDNTYELTWGTAKASNYKVTKEDLGTLTVTKNDAEIVLTAASAQKTYDGTPLSESTVTASGLPEGFTVSAAAAGSITNAGQAENVVSDGYVIKNAAGKDVTACFTNVKKENGTLTIKPAKITITANDGMGPDITDASSLDYEISGDLVEKDRAGLQVQLQLGTSEDTLPKVYPIEVSCAPNANYDITTVNGKYTVHEDVEFTAHGYSGAYDGVEHGIEVEVTKGNPEIIFADEKLDTLQEVKEYAAAHSGDSYGGKDAGTYTFYYYVMLDDGMFVSGSKEIVIEPKELSVTADEKEKTYGDKDPELTYTVEGLEYDDTLTGALDREAGENVGSYAILQGTLDAGKNYTIMYEGADLTINKRTVTVTADPKTKTEGNVDPALTYTAENLVEGDTLSGALARESGEAAGRYAILQGTLDAGANYTIAYTGADLTITAKPTPTPTEAPEPTQKPEDTVTPTPTEKPEPTQKPEDIVTPTPTERPEDTVTPTPTEAPEDTVTPTPTEAPEDTVTPTPTEKPEDTVTPTPTEAPEDTVTPTPTEAPEDTVTPTPTDKPVDTVTPTPTDKPVDTVTPTQTEAPEDTVTPTPTEAPEDTVTPTPTEAPEDTVTPTPTEEPEEITYTFVSGDGGKWKKGSTATLDFVVKRNEDDSQTFSLFTGIEIDGDEVSADDYDAEAGSVKISLKPSYLKTLSKGKHTIKALFTDGSAEAEFRVTTDSSDDSGSDDDNSGSTGRGSGSSLSDDADAGAARTGDDSQPFQWLMLLLLSMAAIMVTGLTLRKKQK